jgi:superfamily I DNA/RNA helicase
MKLTQEQYAIIQSVGDIKINAVAGSGKTTTVIEYAKSRPSTSRILYLAFNKSVKLEAQRRFAEKGLLNVTVETAHSLAFRYIIPGSPYKLRTNGYSTGDIVEILGLQSSAEKHAEYVVASHINKFISYFCNSDKRRVQELNYQDTITDDEARKFVVNFYPEIEQQTRNFLAKMDRAEIEITHDFYLKKFQLSAQQLNYDHILFDEGQDASAAMLDVFLAQKATKVIVGDTHQQIYGWRHAVNSLESVSFEEYSLSASFRFNQVIADLAKNVLDLKKHIDAPADVHIKGSGDTVRVKTRAVIARTNLGLLLKAIQYVTLDKSLKRIYFEGNIHSYTYADDGASLYDVLNLYNGEQGRIRDKLLKGMKDLSELEEYIEKTEDVQMSTLVEVVREYGNEIPAIIKKIKDRHVGNEDRSKAELIFSTVHRCKGMEYDAVELANDFITEEKLEKLKDDIGAHAIFSKLNEEINLLYVAVTRTTGLLYIPEALLPAGFPSSDQIHVIKPTGSKGKEAMPVFARPVPAPRKSEKQEQESAYLPWAPEEDAHLRAMFNRGTKIPDIAARFGRTTGAIRSRLKKIGLIKTEQIKR